MMTTATEGFILHKELLAPDDIASLRTAIEDSLERTARAMLTPYDTSRPGLPLETRLDAVAHHDHAYASALLQIVMADVQRDVRFTALASHPRLSAAVRDAVAPEIPSGHVIRARAAIAAFGARRSPWHQDVTEPEAKTGCARVRIACWIPLSDVTSQSGALEVLPGQWHEPLPHVQRDGGHFEIPENALPARERRAVPMSAGDVLLLDRFIPHRALPTTPGVARWAAVMWVKTGEASGC
jgi:ectoine hydroxylase-related dioxygenase (phytanoyl-CoA dioxygenase family)